LKLYRTEMSMIRWMCGVKLNERKKSEELTELLGLEPVSVMIKKSRLRWFGHFERKDDNDWVKRCITWKVEGIRPRGRLKKTWWDYVKNDMQASNFIRQNNIMTILIQDVNNTMAGYQKEILPSSWSTIVKYSVYNINK